MKKTLLVALAVCLVAGSAQSARKAKPAEGRGQAIDLLAQGQAMEADGDTQGAFTAYQQSAQVAPSPAAYYNLGRIAAARGDKAAAIEYLRKALELNPGYQSARVELARLEGGGAVAATSGDAPMNVDVMQNEQRTIRSLRNPVVVETDFAATDAGEPLETAQVIPPAPQRPGAGDPPAASAAPQNPPPAEAARAAVEPQGPVKVRHETKPLVRDNRMGDPAKPATPAQAPPAEAGREQRPVPPQEPGVRMEPVQAAGGATRGGPQGGVHGAEAINAVAFGPEDPEVAKKSATVPAMGSSSEIVLGTFEFHKDRAERYRLANRWADAAMEYEVALKMRPDDGGLRALYAEALSRSGEADLSVDQMARAAGSAPDDPKVYFRMGNVYRDQKKYDQAIGAYRRALDLDPSDKFAHNNLGVVYMEKGDYASAVRSFKRVVELDPAYDKAVLNLGIIYDDNLADKAQAAKYYQRYLDLRGERSAEVQRWLDAINRQAGGGQAQ